MSSPPSLPVGSVVVLLLGAALLAGCGDDGSDEERAAKLTTAIPFPTALPSPRDLTQGQAERASLLW